MFQEEIEILIKKDPTMLKIVERIGPCNLQLERDPFVALLKAILYQQLSIKAAATICNRFFSLFTGNLSPTSREVLGMPDELLRKVGISHQKVRYLMDLAQKMNDGAIMFDKFHEMNDEEIIENLIQGKGIGRWTAEMFLIFSLGRTNVLPLDDLGLRTAIEKHYGSTNKIQIERLRKKWEPYCTVVTWYLWQDLSKDPTKKV